MTFLFTYLHFLSFVVLAGLLAGEFFVLREPLDKHSLRLLKKIDLAYGLAAGLVVATGIGRVFLEKGWSYYLSTPVFWVKIAIFIGMAIVSIYPTIYFIRTKTDSDPSLSKYIILRKAMLLQLSAIPVILFCAIWIARGFY
ncbi:MAG TPA: DUF2214 family protein [Alphaproteobacteria bacterium]|nr:DUF2214 family protein [Alphaproteobacteria bacterium]